MQFDQLDHWSPPNLSAPPWQLGDIAQLPDLRAQDQHPAPDIERQQCHGDRQLPALWPWPDPKTKTAYNGQHDTIQDKSGSKFENRQRKGMRLK